MRAISEFWFGTPAKPWPVSQGRVDFLGVFEREDGNAYHGAIAS